MGNAFFTPAMLSTAQLMDKLQYESSYWTIQWRKLTKYITQQRMEIKQTQTVTEE